MSLHMVVMYVKPKLTQQNYGVSLAWLIHEIVSVISGRM